MPIPPVILDNLNWSDLTTATRGRIPAASKGRWTLHSPTDPGITLLELQAWLIEQRLYWMDQVSDSLTRGALALLGASAKDAQCASTVFSLGFSPVQAGRVAAGTLMELQDSKPPLVFSVQDNTTVLPLAGVPSVSVGGVDRTGELATGQSVCVFAKPGEELQITLHLAQALAAPAASDEISLAFLLDADGVASQWAAEATSVATPAPLSWRYATAGSQRATFAAKEVDDGTGGMRRSGIVRLKLPSNWAAIASGNTQDYALWVRAEAPGFDVPARLTAVWPNVAVARHRRISCRLHEVDWLPLPGNTIALAPDELPPLFDGTKVRLRESDGKWHWWLPTQDFTFHGREDRVFVIDREAGTLTFGNGETGRIPVLGWRFTLRDILDGGALAKAWRGTDPVSVFICKQLTAQDAAKIADYAPGSRLTSSAARVLERGLNAALDAAALYDAVRSANVILRPTTQALLALDPVPGSTTHQHLNRALLEDAYPAILGRGAAGVTVAVGGGAAGNVGALRAWEPYDDRPGPAPLAVNIALAEGGEEAETLDAARQRTAAALGQPDRAVIADDFEALARTTPGVAIARAHAAVGNHPDFPCLPVPGAVTVFIVPRAPRDAEPLCPRVVAPIPDRAAIGAVAARLDSARLIGSQIFVRAPIYRPVALTVSVRSEDPSPETLRRDVATRLEDFLDPLIGGDGNNGWPFGEPIRPSAVLREAEAALNGRGEVTGVSVRLLDVCGAEDESCNDTDIGAHALVKLETLTVLVASVPAGITGGLQ